MTWAMPGPALLYTVLYIGSLVLHMVFMSYVVTGSLWVAAAGLRRRVSGGHESPITENFKDWLPFALSGAITAGVAPLLFVQVLYPHAFNTANLLLWHRWMAILPALIAAFYLFYITKSKFAERSARVRKLSAVLAAACVLFVGWSWVENHLLSLRSVGDWAEMYKSGRMVHFEAALPVRVAMWVMLALPTGAAAAAWQLRSTSPREGRGLAVVAMTGLVLGVLLAAVYATMLPGDLAARLGAAAPIACAVVGATVLVQLAAWWKVRGAGLDGAPGWALAASFGGAVVMLAALDTAREMVRAAAYEPERLAAFREVHAQALRESRVSAMAVFGVLAVGGVGVVVWMVRAIAREVGEGGGEGRRATDGHG